MKQFESTGCHDCILALFDGNALDTCALDHSARIHDNINSKTFYDSCPLKDYGGKVEVLAVEFIIGE